MPNDHTPAPRRDAIQSFPTPNLGDIVVFIEKDSKMPANQVFAYGDSHPDSNKYPDHVMVYYSPESEERWARWYFAKEREGQDEYNFEFVQADIGGNKFDAVQRTYYFLRSDFDPTTPIMGAANPDTPTGKFPAGYVLAIRRQVRSPDKELDSLFIFEQRTYVKKVTTDQIGSDPFNGQQLYSRTTLYYATEVVTGGLTAAQLFDAPTNTFWGLQTDGSQNVGQQLSDGWYSITNEQVIGGTLSPGGVLTVRTYTSSINFSWPPVLDPANPIDVKDWELKDGASRYYPSPVFKREGYSGPCKATITETWSTTPFTIAAPDVVKPVPISYNCPFFSINIGPTLHGAVQITADTGSNDPTWGVNVGSTRTFAATDPSDWPTSITLDDQKPFRGGYLRQVVVINKPFT